MTRPLVIIGCGGFGREVFHTVQAINRTLPAWVVKAFVDDNPSELDLKRVAALGSTHLGTVADLAGRAGDVNVAVAIGSPAARADVVGRLATLDVAFPVLIHPDATVCPDAILGAGSIIAAGARINTNVTLGNHVHVDQNATIGHDSKIGDFARLNPQACVSGAVTVGARCQIGAGATILQGLNIGADAFVGAAACVVRDTPDAVMVKGVPAR